MAVLKIYNEIVDEEDKLMLQSIGADSTTFSDIREFIKNIPTDDPAIDIRLHCDGGNCVEGWSIYDALRQTRKTISATVEGKCSSIATIILLAAPRERRFAFRNASICIHNPALAGYSLPEERLTPDALDRQSEKMKDLAMQLQIETNKILDLYVERTGSDRLTLKKLMEKDIFIDMQIAIELGFIGSILPEMTDNKKSSTFKNNKKMEKEGKIECDAAAVQRVCTLFGVEKIEDLSEMKILDQYISSSSGEGFTVEREDGDPQIGDIAYPDGDYVMEDGSHVIVQDGVITDITKPDDEITEPGSEEEITPEQQQAIISDLQAQLDGYKKQVADRKAEIVALKETAAQVDDLKKSQITVEQKDILAVIAKAGGKKWLDKVTSMKSTFTVKNRQFVAHKNPIQEDGKETKTQRMIREAKEANAKKRNGRTE